ncbi:MAG: ribosomal protein S18-alanine N-acetyltransferase [Clostridiales bacterium]|nr:ribosomal protein S18-alanine N-acetyltransferase [Clostridiales bacterium]
MDAVIEIRKAKLSDIPAISRLEVESSNTPWSAKALTYDVTQNEKAYVIVADKAGDKVGYADAWIFAGEAQINNIAVLDEYRGQGIGDALLTHLLEFCKERTCRIVTLEVRKSNEPAISMYKKHGFEIVGTRREYYRDNKEDALLMNKEINAIEVEVDVEDNHIGSSPEDYNIEIEII